MKPIREAQKKQTQQKIKLAISQLVQEKSYESITIREICQRAGIAVGSYYNYYHSKDEIIFKAMEQSAEATREKIQPMLNKENCL